MKKVAIAVLSGCLLLTAASATASAAPAEHHKMHAKSETKHKMHAKSTHKLHAKSAHKHKLKAKSAEKGKILGKSKFKAKAITPKALPKTGYGGVSE
ncbi:hypothetical protein [Cohnella thailandensis]|uniref:Acid-shock protein n=1 Tax=Cohnella thailandensis TaxID=557557 RepID=A0A841SWC2_9BACL|nr:hypothetical protein [Cohnella thailandensis]MBB6633927.1 hypothetical protein [Cohnella thailandensis]MBP1972610.1 hypothetical protein [Cohnella thailandensis]